MKKLALLFLNRFDIDKDKFESKIKKLNIKLEEDKEHRFLAEYSNEEVFDDIIYFNETDKVVFLEHNWQEFKFGEIKEMATELSEKISGQYKSFFIHTRLLSPIPIAAKSINKKLSAVFKAKGMTAQEKNPQVMIFVELDKDNGKKIFRIGYSPQDYWQKRKSVEKSEKEIAVIVENPELELEIGDFLRVCWIFKLKLRFLVTKDKDKFQGRLIRAMKETKSIHYAEFDMKTIDEFEEEFSGYTKIAFTRHTEKNEEQLIDLIKNKNGKFLFMFGNEKFGLSQEMRDKADYLIRLTPDLKKPLRGSQALSYVLGIEYIARK